MVDLVLVALVPALAALALVGAVALDHRSSLVDARADRHRAEALAALAELRGAVLHDRLAGEAALDIRSGDTDATVGALVDRVVQLDLDALLRRPAPETAALEAVAGLGTTTRARHDLASDRIAALMVEVAGTADAGGSQSALMLALSDAEQLAVDATVVADAAAPGGDVAIRLATTARLQQALVRLGADLAPADARRLAAAVPAALVPETAAAPTPLADPAAGVAVADELRALRRDLGASQQAATAGRVDDLERQLRIGAVVVAVTVLVLLLAAGSSATRIVGGLGRIDERVRRLLRGDLAPAEPEAPHGRELADVGSRLDDLVVDLRTVEERAVALGEPEPESGVEVDLRPLAARLLAPTEAIDARATVLQSREAFARGLIEATDEAIFTVDDASRVAWANAAAARLFAMPVDDLVGSSSADLVGRLPLLGDLPVGITNADSTVVTSNGTVRSVLVSTRLLGDDDHPTVAVFARDISERRELEHQLSHQATHDDLTGLGNRASLVAELDRARARAQRSGQGFGLLFIDLDRFKLVNDTLGHRTGDLVLREISARLRSATRDSDFVARNGGDEFVVIAEEAPDIGTVVRLAERIQDELALPLLIEDDSIPVSASIGVTWLDPDDANSLDQLRNADVAMYQAKSAGPGQVRVFDEDMRSWVEQRFDLERALRKAVGRGELEAFVQPIIDLRTGRVTSGELLCRWTLEDGREIPPDAFIEVAEDSTLVVEIGRWVLDRAGTLLAHWEQSPRLSSLGLSVNISGRHIDHPNVVADVAGALRRTGADPRRLAIEITETSLLRDLQEAAATLGELHDLGVSISVDDFGVGYASLRYLRELPVELVKIDRSIVAGFERVDSDTVIVTMLSRLADVLDIGIVAEGVETEEQRERLSEIGCHFAQGFLFAPAMAVPEFEQWFALWERQHTHPARWHELAKD